MRSITALGVCLWAGSTGCSPDREAQTRGPLEGTESQAGTTESPYIDPPTTPVVPLGDTWIGDPCVTAEDCTYDGAVCLTEADGFPEGHCSLSCPDYCPDATGFVETFCPAVDQLPSAAAALGDGACTSRCDFGAHPFVGCREGYGCVVADRATIDDQAWTCLPNVATAFSTCLTDLAARGVAFRPTVREDDHPADVPALTCHVEDPVWLDSPVAGLDLRYYYDAEPGDVLLGCEGAHALVDSAEDVGAFGAIEIVHLGTYNCRTIAGTETLSQHGLGNAIDLSYFTLADGHTASVYEDWEHGTDAPATEDGAFLYDAVHRWYDAWLWNIILTPEYNDAHDNHFHVDMTPDSHFLGLTDSPPHTLGTMTGTE